MAPPDIPTSPPSDPPDVGTRVDTSATVTPPPLANLAAHDENIPALAATVALPPTNPDAPPPVTAQLKDPEVKDYGWNVPPNKVPAPVIHGISNDDLYMLVRRFNKQIFHVKAIPELPTGSLDLEYSPMEEFSPDKLRATLERLYMTVIIGIAAFGKHIARLRSWNEPWRTAWFCAVYYFSWFYNIVTPVFLITLVTLIVEPRSRKILFPPAPMAMISARTGNLQKPKAGALGSNDSLSGAQEQHQGEAVEQEARHFVSGFATIAVSTAAGKGPGEDGTGNAVGGGEAAAQGLDKQTSVVDGSVPDPVNVVLGGVEAKDLASGDNSKKDAAKEPVNAAMWEKARPFMQILEDLADGWERWGNALSPTPPFPTHRPRLRLAAPLVPLVLITCFVGASVFARIFTFFLGLAFFGDPVLIRAAHWLTHRVPNWREYLELRRTLLIGVPTNAQLTLTLLRVAEAQKAPLPPPPSSLDAPTAEDPNSETDESDLEADMSNYSIDTDNEESASGDTASFISDTTVNGDKEGKEPTSPKRRPGRKVAGFLKRAVKAGVGGAMSIDQVKAAAGSENAKRRIGALTDPPLTDVVDSDDVTTDPVEHEQLKEDPKAKTKKLVAGPIENNEGPSVFTGRMHGKRGYILLINSATSPCIAFAYTKPSSRSFKSRLPGITSRTELDAADIHPEFTIGLGDIVGLRKVGGFGWKGKIIVGWALGREVVDGLEVTEKSGKAVVLTAIRGRDELFNRLIAAGGHKWECW
ncbi:hypothetical protein EIP91_006335 [Steccherinum ochraceum]|uniref:Uncharacterized protein n=1 Tax=Steccherinum ochraceum TaxID=92696 RepID=A0A4R0RKL0_9APHY|nr:hypothetical protein EIP91_006335 [Steccherinum ochraceum]